MLFVIGVAVTGEFDYPLPSVSIELPYSRANCKTGLNKPSIAKCDWIVQVFEANVIKRMGFIPSSHLLSIIEEVQKHLPPPPPQEPMPPNYLH
jgi:hypothetical protein